MTFLMAGCVSVQKQRNRAETFYKLHPEELTARCAEKFVSPSPIYIKGKDSIRIDTVTVAGDSVKCPDVINPDTGEKSPGVKLKCPDSKTITKYKDRVDTLKIVPPEMLALIEQQEIEIKQNGTDLSNSKDETKDALKTAANRLWVIIGLSVLIAGYALLKFVIKKFV